MLSFQNFAHPWFGSKALIEEVNCWTDPTGVKPAPREHRYKQKLAHLPISGVHKHGGEVWHVVMLRFCSVQEKKEKTPSSYKDTTKGQ
jgi:hypothetical protein